MRGRWLLVLGVALLPAGTAQAASVFVAKVNTFPGQVYPLNMAANGTISIRSTPSYPTAGNGAFDVAVLPSGRNIYVSLDNTPGSINQFSVGAAGALTGLSPPTVSTGPPRPGAIVVSPDGSSVYAAEDNNGALSIGQWTVRANGTLTAKAPGAVAASGAEDIVMTPNGRYLYVSNFGFEGAIQEFSVGPGGRLNPIGSAPTGEFPLGMAVTPNGRYLYVGLDSSPLVVEEFAIGAGGSLTALTPSTVSLPASTYPLSLATSPGGRNLYVGDDIGGHGIVQFSIAASGALKGLTPETVGTQHVNQLAFSPDGHNLYATAQTGAGNTVRYTVAANGALTQTSNVALTGVGSAGIAVTPDQGPVASFKASPARAGLATKFDAGGSHDPDGQILSYAWSFGDGNRKVTTGPTVSHVYQQTGTYNVTLTVTDNDGASTTIVFTGHQVLLNGSPAARIQHKVTIS